MWPIQNIRITLDKVMNSLMCVVFLRHHVYKLHIFKNGPVFMSHPVFIAINTNALPSPILLCFFIIHGYSVCVVCAHAKSQMHFTHKLIIRICTYNDNMWWKIACMEFILRVVWTSYLTSCGSSELNILFLLLIYFNWNYFVMRSNTIRRA